MSKHRAHVFNTLEEFLKHHAGSPSDWSSENKYKLIVRHLTRRWKRWAEKHPGKPYIAQCSICSGQDEKWALKHGKVKKSTREATRFLREELSEREPKCLDKLSSNYELDDFDFNDE